MKIFKDYTFPWYDMAALKGTLLLIGLYIGATWPEFFAGWTNILLILGIIGLVYLAFKYWPTMFGKEEVVREEHTV